MTTPHRRRILGDVGENAPERWDWGGPAAPVDARAAALRAGRRGPRGARAEHAARRWSRSSQRLGTADLDGFEPFGFRDGISQPFVEGLGKSGPARDDGPRRRVPARLPERVRPLTGRPLLDPRPTRGMLPRDARAPVGRPRAQRQLPRLPPAEPGRRPGSGSSSTQPRGAPTGGATRTRGCGSRRRWSAAGRAARRSRSRRTPTTRASPTRTTSPTTRTIPRGVRCPVGSHIRRSNPRDSLDPDPGSDARSRSTGATGSCAAAASTGRRCRSSRRSPARDSAERGLHFICLNANIARQFEFVQHTWLNNPSSAGSTTTPTRSRLRRRADFTIPTEGVRERVTACRASCPSRAAPTSSCPAWRRSATSRSRDRGRAGKVSSPVGS